MAIAWSSRQFDGPLIDPDLRDGLERTQRPIDEARGLPNAAYTDPDLYRLERDRLMARTWVCIGFSEDLAGPGAIRPFQFMGLPLFMLRNQQGGVNVFHNVCSHRGMQLVGEAATLAGNKLRCPYHSWTYDLDGNLRGTPHIGGPGTHNLAGFEPCRHGLRRVRSAVWLGMIFINLSGDAPEFSAHVAPLEARWQALSGGFEFDRLCHPDTGASLDMEVESNWKLAVENYCESYHLPWIHPALNSYSRLEDHYGITLDGPFSGQVSQAYKLAEVTGAQLPCFPAWPTERARQAEYVAFYPNVLLGLQADHVFTLVLEPVSCHTTREHLRIYYVGAETAGAAYAPARAATLESWRVVFTEDVAAVEGLQRGRQSPAFAGGVFSSVMGVATHHFHRWVAQRISETGQDGLSSEGKS